MISMYTPIRDWSLIAGEGGGLQNSRKEGSFSHVEEGGGGLHNKFW